MAYSNSQIEIELLRQQLEDVKLVGGRKLPYLINPSPELQLAVKYGKDKEEYQARLKYPPETDLLFDDTDYSGNYEKERQLPF